MYFNSHLQCCSILVVMCLDGLETKEGGKTYIASSQKNSGSEIFGMVMEWYTKN